jgi:hypothetical protein
MGGIIPGTVPRIIPTIYFADVRVVSENGRGLYTRSGRRIAKLPISLGVETPPQPVFAAADSVFADVAWPRLGLLAH